MLCGNNRADAVRVSKVCIGIYSVVILKAEGTAVCFVTVVVEGNCIETGSNVVLTLEDVLCFNLNSIDNEGGESICCEGYFISGYCASLKRICFYVVYVNCLTCNAVALNSEGNLLCRLELVAGSRIDESNIVLCNLCNRSGDIELRSCYLVVRLGNYIVCSVNLDLGSYTCSTDFVVYCEEGCCSVSCVGCYNVLCSCIGIFRPAYKLKTCTVEEVVGGKIKVFAVCLCYTCKLAENFTAVSIECYFVSFNFPDSVKCYICCTHCKVCKCLICISTFCPTEEFVSFLCEGSSSSIENDCCAFLNVLCNVCAVSAISLVGYNVSRCCIICDFICACSAERIKIVSLLFKLCAVYEDVVFFCSNLECTCCCCRHYITFGSRLDNVCGCGSCCAVITNDISCVIVHNNVKHANCSFTIEIELLS